MSYCKFKGCKTKLNMYNKHKYCFAHLYKGLLMDMEKKEERTEFLRKKNEFTVKCSCSCGLLVAGNKHPPGSCYTCVDCYN